MKRVLITGGAGFIGSHIADHLLAEGNRVLVVDNLTTGRVQNLAKHPELKVIERDIAEPLDYLFQSFCPDVVVHAAASYKDPDNWSRDVETNALGTANLVQASIAAGVQRLIYFQTALCYGTQPLEQPITLEHPLRPDSSYAISKTAGEQYIAHSGLDFVSLRLANAYGPRNLSGPLPAFYRRLTAGEECVVVDSRRDFIFIHDLIRVVLRAVHGSGSGIYHVASGSDFSIRELWEATVDALGLPGNTSAQLRPRAEGDAATILLDPSRTADDYAWEPVVALRDGVRWAVRHYAQFGVGETYTHLKL